MDLIMRDELKGRDIVELTNVADFLKCLFYSE
jgi:hypothetical protein